MNVLYIHHWVAQEVEYYPACEHNGDQDLSFANGKDAGISRQTEYWDWGNKSSSAKIQVQFSLENTIYDILHCNNCRYEWIKNHSWFYGTPTEG